MRVSSQVQPIATPLSRPITSPGAGGGGDPLLAAMLAESPIIAYDNNDLSTFFADQTGTTPASINGVCGLQLDKSEGLVLAANQLANGDFATDTVWTKGVGWTIADGKAQSNNAAGVFSNLAQGGHTVTGGVFYQVTFTVSDYVSGGIVPRVATNPGNRVAANGTYTQIILSVATVTNVDAFYFRTDNGFVGSIDNVTLRALPGYHRYQANLANRPVLRGTPTGGNLFTAYSSPGAGWVDSGGGVATATAASSAISTNVVPVIGRVYRLQFTVTNAGGSVRSEFGGVNGPTRTTSGTFTEYVTALSTAALRFNYLAAFTGTVSAVEIHDVSADAVTAPYFLHYDGVDDFMQTASVDLTGTDEVTVCSGLTRIGNGLGAFVELSVDSNVNDAFVVFAAIDTANSIQFSTRGTTPAAQSQIRFTDSAPPSTTVLTCTSDRALTTNEVGIRRNGVVPIFTRPNNDNLAGNFGNYPLYFGRRAGTSLPFNGYDFGCSIFPVVKSGAGLAAVEAFHADRTGVVL